VKFDWKIVEKIAEIILGKGALMVDPDGLGALIVKKDICLAVIQLTNNPDTIIVCLRASISPNVAALLVANLTIYFRVDLDPNFEFSHSGDMLMGKEATRFFIDNAKLIVYGERDPSVDSLPVRNKGSYMKHKFN